MTLLSVLTLIFAVFRFIFTRKQVTSINTNLLFSFPSEKQINCIDRHLNWLHFIPVDSLMIHVSIKACAVWRTCKLCFSKASYPHSSSHGGGQTPEIAGLGWGCCAWPHPFQQAWHYWRNSAINIISLLGSRHMHFMPHTFHRPVSVRSSWVKNPMCPCQLLLNVKGEKRKHAPTSAVKKKHSHPAQLTISIWPSTWF